MLYQSVQVSSNGLGFIAMLSWKLVKTPGDLCAGSGARIAVHSQLYEGVHPFGGLRTSTMLLH